MIMYLNAVVLVSLIYCGLCSTDQKTKSEKEFVPSKEWQTIEEGQQVPRGLHYRINLSTGKKEAKIIDSEAEKQQKATQFVLKENIRDKDKLRNDDVMERFLKDVNKKNPEDDMPKKFPSLDEIKKQSADDKLQATSDIDILKDLLKKIEDEEKNPKTDKYSIESLIYQLRLLCHKTDNANTVYRMDGFKKIIYKYLNSTSESLKKESLYLFSALAEHNSNIKQHILETGGLTAVLKLMALDKHPEVKIAALKALGCTIRAFPVAQFQFIEMGGLHILRDLFKTESLKMKVKLINLLYDLISERQIEPHNFKNHQSIDLENALLSLGWCTNFNDLLRDVMMADINDFDSIEKCLLVMDLMASKCKDSYKNDIILKLHKQLTLLAELNEDNSDDNYFQNLSTLILNVFGSSTNHTPKEEL